MKKILIVTIFLLLGFSYLGKAQTTTIDSLRVEIKNQSSSDSIDIENIYKIGRLFSKINQDSLSYYFNMLFKKHKNIEDKNLKYKV